MRHRNNCAVQYDDVSVNMMCDFCARIMVLANEINFILSLYNNTGHGIAYENKS